MKTEKYKLLEKTPNYVKLYMVGQPLVIHLVKSGRNDKEDVTYWFRLYEDAYDTEPWQTGIQTMSDATIKEKFGKDPNTYYSIWHESDYLHSGKNSKSKRSCLKDWEEYMKGTDSEIAVILNSTKKFEMKEVENLLITAGYRLDATSKKVK